MKQMGTYQCCCRDLMIMMNTVYLIAVMQRNNGAFKYETYKIALIKGVIVLLILNETKELEQNK